MKRKLLATGLLFALLLSTTACGATAESTGQDTNNDTASASEITEAEDTAAEDTTEELPQVANLELTEGVVNGNRYENDSFGVAFTIPEGLTDDTANSKTVEASEDDPNYNQDYYLLDYAGVQFFFDDDVYCNTYLCMYVTYVELLPEEAAKSDEEIVRDSIQYLESKLPHIEYVQQEHVIGTQTYYGYLGTSYNNDGALLSLYEHAIYIIRDNKVMKIEIYSNGSITDNSPAYSDLVDQYTQEILNSLELK